MPGRSAAVPPALVARLFAAAEPATGPFARGLSAFPERPTAATFTHANFGGYTLTPIRFGGYTLTPTRFGGYTLTPPRFGDVSSAVTVGTDAAQIAAATAAGGPIAGGVVAIQDLSSAFSAGSTRDAQRAARANYFGNLAMGGNAAAAQMIIAAPAAVASDEAPMWQVWINQMQNAPAGSPGYNAYHTALTMGPPPNMPGQTATNYPLLKQYAANWAAQHPFAGATPATAVAALVSPTGLLIAGGLVAAFVLLRRRR